MVYNWCSCRAQKDKCIWLKQSNRNSTALIDRPRVLRTKSKSSTTQRNSSNQRRISTTLLESLRAGVPIDELTLLEGGSAIDDKLSYGNIVTVAPKDRWSKICSHLFPLICE